MWGIKMELFSESFLPLPSATFLTLPLLSLLRFLRSFNQIVDLLVSEHLAEKRIILILLPQCIVFFPEPVRTIDQILVLTEQLPVLLLDTDIVVLYLPFEQNEKSYLTLKSDSSYFSLFDGVISDVAKTLPNAVLEVQKPSIGLTAILIWPLER